MTVRITKGYKKGLRGVRKAEKDEEIRIGAKVEEL
jgi:hypothetical protein